MIPPFIFGWSTSPSLARASTWGAGRLERGRRRVVARVGISPQKCTKIWENDGTVDTWNHMDNMVKFIFTVVEECNMSI